MTYLIRQLDLERDLHDVHQLTIQLGYPSTLENIKQRWEHRKRPLNTPYEFVL